MCDFCTDFQMKFGFSTLGRTGQTTTYRAERESEEKTITKTRINSTAQVLQSWMKHGLIFFLPIVEWKICGMQLSDYSTQCRYTLTQFIVNTIADSHTHRTKLHRRDPSDSLHTNIRIQNQTTSEYHHKNKCFFLPFTAVKAPKPYGRDCVWIVCECVLYLVVPLVFILFFPIQFSCYFHFQF